MAKEIRPLYRTNDSTGVDEIFYPATTTDAIAHPTKQKSLTNVLGEIENGSVYDISAAHNNQPYADLTAALDSNNGGGVPQSLQKGGMSIKFIQGTVQGSDHKYVQFRYMSTSTAAADFTNVTNWQGVDESLIPGSDNLAKSGLVAEGFLDVEYGKVISEEQLTVVSGNYNMKNKSIGDNFTRPLVYSETTKCLLKAVVANEVYEITGKGISTTVGSYILTDSNYIIIDMVSVADYRTNPKKLYIKEAGWLYVNLADYDAQTDGVKQLIRDGSKSIEGLYNKVNTLVVDNLTTDDATKALSAKQGKVLNENIETLDADVNGEDEHTDYLVNDDVTITAVPRNTANLVKVTNISLHAGETVVFDVSSNISDVLNSYNYYIEGLMEQLATVNSDVTHIEVPVLEDVTSLQIYINTKTTQWKGDAAENLPITLHRGISVVIPEKGGLNKRVADLESSVSTIVEDLDSCEEDISALEETVNGEDSKVITLSDRTINVPAKPSTTSALTNLNNVPLTKGDVVVFEVDQAIEDLLNKWGYYVQGQMVFAAELNTTTHTASVPITSSFTAPRIYVQAKTSYWKEGATFPGSFNISIKIQRPAVQGLTDRVEELEERDNEVYNTVTEAVEDGIIGNINVGENVVIGVNSLSSPYTAADIEKNYVNILPCPKFPFIKKVTLQRLYDDAATPNMLYICSHSDKHIFYSICPTDSKHAVFESFEQYNSNYFYYADKNTPSTLTKVVLPSIVDGVNIARRIKYVFEMSNGDCFVEIENGARYTSNDAHHNIYKVSNVFSGNAIQESDIALSLSFDVRNERISAFDQIQEYKAGHIVLAPYGSKKTAKVYITKNYGTTWDLIFCADDENETHLIKPKATRLGDANAYGVWPTEPIKIDGEYVPNEDGLYVSADGSYVSENPLDWSATGNGNIHIHGIAYDPWYDRIWICTGDGHSLANNVTGIWWTDDEGLTWKRIGGKNIIGTQLMGVIPMEHCVLFSTDGSGDGYWRWSRNGKDKFIKIENCYNFLGTLTNLVVEAGRTIKATNGFILTSFAPDNETQGDWANKGGIAATYNGFAFEKIYEDSFSQRTFESAEIGWNCDITDCGDKLILKADKGGYIQLDY